MKITNDMTDDTVLGEIGTRLAGRRLDLNLTQARLAREAGISKRTVERIESGASAQISSYIRVFRVLELLDDLDRILPEPGPRPMDLLKLQGKMRQRASSPRSGPETGEDEWTWGDES